MHLHALASSLILSQVNYTANNLSVLIQLDTSQVAGLPLNLHAYLVPGSLQTLPDLDLPLAVESPTVKSREFYLHDDVIDVLHVLDFCCVECGVS